MSILLKETELVDNLSLLPSWEERYQYIIELGESLQIMEEEKKTERNLIKGCQSKLWLSHTFGNNKIYFFADSESPFPKGLAALFLLIINGHSPNEILSSKLNFLEKTGLKFHLSPVRFMGITNFYKTILNDCGKYENVG
jgi:cysteine desulfuration protein SufE